MSKKIIIGNWKMNPLSPKQAENLFRSILKAIPYKLKANVIICPPAIYLGFLKTKNYKLKVNLGAQDAFYEESGAYTGEISAEMLYYIGARYVILGHSERRSPPSAPSGGGEGESNLIINKKVRASLSAGLVPILCVGEKERDESHQYLNFIKKQIEECLKGVIKSSVSKIIIAYEPIWAIGKNAQRAAVPKEFLEMSIFIKKVLSDKFGAKAVEKTKIIYGGSVNPKNTADFLMEGETDGFLVGRDSLDPKKFREIIKICEA